MQQHILHQPTASDLAESGPISTPDNAARSMRPLSAAQLQQRIIWSAGIGIVVICLIVAGVSLVPFYQHLHDDAGATLARNVSTRALAIEEHLVRTSDIAAQITSRTRIREELIAYNAGEMSREELVASSGPKLTDAMRQSADIVGLVRLDRQGAPVIQLGMAIPPETWSFVRSQGTIEAITLSDPLQIEAHPYLVVAAPIKSATATVGTDLVMFDLAHLQELVRDTTDMGDSSSSVLGSPGATRPQVFFDSRQAAGAPTAPAAGMVVLAMQAAAQQESGLLPAHAGSAEIVAYQTLEQTPWVFMVVADRNALYLPVYQQMGLLLAVVAALLIFGTLGVTWLLRPLAGHVVLRAGTLEQEVAHKTARLQWEVQERARAEQELRIFRAMAEHAPDMISFARLDTARITYANPAHQQLLGHEESLTGMHLTDMITEAPDDLLTMVQTTGTPGAWSGVVAYRQADGSNLPVFLTSFLVRDEADNPIAVAGIARDISAQLRLEAERETLHAQVLDAQRAALRELSTPLIPISDRAVIMPLIGTIDTQRARQVMEALLAGIAEQHAEVAILDITGVPYVDTQVANALMQAAQAAKLLGTRVLLTGIQPPIAQIIVQLGIDLRGIETRATLQAGIAAVLERHAGGRG
jgi:anti-anti-sigma factor